MTIYDPDEILCEFLRHRVNDPASRHTSTSDTFNGDGSTTSFTLTPTTDTRVQAVTNVAVDGSDQDKWGDYYVDLQNETVIFKTAPVSGSSNVVVTYDEGANSWIYKDFPLTSLSDSSFPRIGVQVMDGAGRRMGTYEADIETEMRFQIDSFAIDPRKSSGTHIYTISGRDYGGGDLAKVLLFQVKDSLKDYIDDVYPILYDLNIVSTPHKIAWEERPQAYRYMMEITLKMINLGDSL